MSTTLIPVNQTSSEENALAVAQAQFLPRIKLCQGSAKEVAKKKVKAGGHFALVRTKEDIIDLGDEVVIIPIASRAKAMDTNGDSILTNFEPKSPEFLRIQGESKQKDSGCMFGPEFLIWLPELKEFCTFFLASATARKQGINMQKLLGNAGVLTSEYIETEKYSWFGPVAGPYSAPIIPENLPSLEEATQERDKFVAEKSSIIRAADSNEDTGRDR